ncbi:MAG: tRNA (adenosine(37)-N6)-threonylcarbamoyltransferase complex dimerization subunit type 1 TsaB [Solirubrobacteraceae bacterium]
MRILGFDTATRATTVALWDSARPDRAAELRDDPPAGARPAHATKLMALVVQLLARERVSWDELDRLAVGVGPGTFTGLRIGIATGVALARARSLPLYGVSTLGSLALGAQPMAHRCARQTVLAVLDARRHEVFVAGWFAAGSVGMAGAALLAPQAIAPASLAEHLAELEQGPLAVGDGAIEFRDVLERSGALIPADGSGVHLVTAVAHCRLAAEMSQGLPGDVRPEYLRAPDAELVRRAAESR